MNETVGCPEGYSPTADTLGGLVPPCLPSCPVPIYSDVQYDALYYLSTSLYLVALVISPLVLLPHLLTRSKWKWPTQINTWILVSTFFLNLGFLFPILFGGNDWEAMVCSDGTTPADEGVSMCAAQALFTIYWGASGAMWWYILTAHLTLTVFGIKPSPLASAVCCNLLAWLVPLVFVAVAFGGGAVGSSGTTCYIDAAAEDYWWAQSMIYIPFPLLVFTAGVLVCCVMVKMLRMGGPREALRQVRLLLYIGSFLFTQVYYIIFFLSLKRDRDERESGYARFFACRATQTGDPGSCDALLDDSVYPALFVATLLTAYLPLAYFLIFGMQRGVWDWWAQLGMGALRRDMGGFARVAWGGSGEGSTVSEEPQSRNHSGRVSSMRRIPSTRRGSRIASRNRSLATASLGTLEGKGPSSWYPGAPSSGE